MKKQLDPRMYIVVRRDLDMPAGKMAAQVGHAVGRLLKDASYELLADYWNVDKGNEAKIVLGCADLPELLALEALCHKEIVRCELITDAGHTVFNEPTVTCLGVGPVYRHDDAHLFKHLRLY